MDPLSITASIVGILAATAKVSESLHSTISTVKDAPLVLGVLNREVREFRVTLSMLQTLLVDLSSAPPQRTALVHIDHLIATFTECALTVSELEVAVAPYAALQAQKIPLPTRLKWIRAETDCMKLVERMQRHKATVSLMLNILQCASDAEAIRSQSSLAMMVEQLLQINQQLCKRLKKLGDPFDARSSIMAHSSRCSVISNSISAPSAPARTIHNNRESIVETMIRYAFEDELNASRVYRMVKDNDCDRSLLSSAMHTQTWSIFSGLSLADISILSVVALPLFPEDIPEQAQYYAFGTTVPPSVATNVQDAESTVAPRQPLPSGRPASAERDLSLFPAKDVSFAPNAPSGGDLVKEDETQPNEVVSMANLRFASLMTSKWLSFGRVLFSPAHFKLENDLNKDRILVLDWLGRDWSYYCALTYPEATVFNLGLGAPSTPVDGPWSTLRNHLQFRHVSIIHPLPFPKDFFACVVLRFPTALRSTTHNFVLSEIKRVLRPDGYLEFSVLNLDLLNMGKRARRAVRALKSQIQIADKDTSLRNVSDEIIGGLERKRFVNCQTCIVGVPVAGKLYNARSSSTEETGKNTSSSSEMSSKGTNTESSFSDLLNMSPSNGSTTNSVPNMIAHVGRWWYSCCYETLVQPTTDDPAANSSHLLKNSIWKDEKLIKECEERGTTFKMLIGYAKKPDVWERRRVSI